MSRRAFGVELYQYDPAEAVLADVIQCEELGYDAVWLGDSQMLWRDLWVLLGAAAVRTRRVALGAGVTNPVTRHVSVTASAMVTLQELSGGRLLLGTGAGFTAVTIPGLPRATIVQMRRFLRDLRALGQGEAVPAPHGTMRLNFGGPGRGAPLIVAASGPKMLRLAGECADGVILQGRARVGPVLTAMREHVEAGRAAAGRQGEPFRYCLGTPGAVDADRRKALNAVKSHVAVTLLHPLWPIGPAAQAVQEAVRAAYRSDDHMSPEATARFIELIPDEVVPEFAIAGTPAECRAQVEALFAAGVDEVTIRPFGVDGAPRVTMAATYAREVVAPLRGT